MLFLFGLLDESTTTLSQSSIGYYFSNSSYDTSTTNSFNTTYSPFRMTSSRGLIGASAENHYDKDGLLKSPCLENYNDKWKNIPGSIAYSLSFSLIMLVVFYNVRAAHHARKDFYNDWDINWLQFVFSDRTIQDLHPPHKINPMHVDAFYPKYLKGFLHLIDNRLIGNERRTRLHISNQIQEKFIREHAYNLENIGRDRHWLLDYVCIPMKDIHKHRGRDAFLYLKFQQHLIVLMTFMTIICLVVLLPINLQGNQSKTKSAFLRSTIRNLAPNSSLFWIHSVCIIMFTFIALVVMKRYYDSLYISDTETLLDFLQHGDALSTDKRTLFIQNISEDYRKASILKSLIEFKFPGVKITRISFTYGIKTLRYLIKNFDSMKHALYFSEMYDKLHNSQRMISPFTGSRYIPVCPQVNAVEYYTKVVKRLRQCMKDELAKIIAEPQNQVFVRFQTKFQAQKFLQYFEKSHVKSNFRKFLSDYYINIDKGRGDYRLWAVMAAPAPEDIVWQDILDSPRNTFVSYAFRALTFLIFIFLTTPSAQLKIISTVWDYLELHKGGLLAGWKESIIKSSIVNWIKVMTTNTLSLILPNMVMLLEWNRPLKTKSERAHTMMWYMYMFLFLMIIVLPGVDVNSLAMFFNWIVIEDMNKNATKKMAPGHSHWDCYLPSEKSSWYLSLVMSYAVVSNVLEFLRVPDLGMYILYSIIYPKTAAEYRRVRIEMNFVYNMSASYARQLVIVTITIFYCVACPLIMLCGLLYMTGKHLADRYTIYYLHRVPVVSVDTHIAAIQFILFAFWGLHIQVYIYLCEQRVSQAGIWPKEASPKYLLAISGFLYTILWWIIYYYLHKFDPFTRGLAKNNDKNCQKIFDTSKTDIDDDQLILAMENLCKLHEQRKRLKRLKFKEPRSVSRLPDTSVDD